MLKGNMFFFQSNTQDQIILQWESGDSAIMHVLVVHAMIILLTYGPPKGNNYLFHFKIPSFSQLLCGWVTLNFFHNKLVSPISNHLWLSILNMSMEGNLLQLTMNLTLHKIVFKIVYIGG